MQEYSCSALKLQDSGIFLILKASSWNDLECNSSRVSDPDPDPHGSACFCPARIRIRINPRKFRIQFQTAHKKRILHQNGPKMVKNVLQKIVLQKYVETCLKYITFNPLIDCEIWIAFIALKHILPIYGHSIYLWAYAGRGEGGKGDGAFTS